MDSAHPEVVVKTRLCAAGAQAFLLMLLFVARAGGWWPSTQPPVFAALFLVLLFVPLLVVQAAGHLPGRWMAWWVVIATVFGAVFGAHDVLRRAPGGYPSVSGPEYVLPQAPAAVFFAAAVFITHGLITAAAADRRKIAAYTTYFEVAWKQGVQGVAGGAFVVVSWLMLNLGAELFNLIKLDFLKRLIEHAAVTVPLLTLAFAASLHVTDIRPQIIRSIKTVMLTLLSWLLPAATLIAAGFLISLSFTGLAPLWATKTATTILLACAAGLIALLNTAYQDGTGIPARFLRVVGTVAAVLPFPLVVLAGYGLGLRVAQYGWTNDRVIAAACVAIAACYALGYLWAAISRGRWLATLETANIAASCVALGLILALFTPVADPARIATNSQLARLASGQVAPEQFDFLALRFDGGRYGYEAVQKLQTAGGSNKDFINAAAGRAMAAQHKLDSIIQPLNDASLTAALATPSGARLPESFVNENWISRGDEARALAECVRAGAGSCTALQVDIDGDRSDEVLVINPASEQYWVFRAEAGGWRIAGHIANLAGCAETKTLLTHGAFRLEAPAWPEIVVGGRRLSIVPRSPPCPK